MDRQTFYGMGVDVLKALEIRRVVVCVVHPYRLTEWGEDGFGWGLVSVLVGDQRAATNLMGMPDNELGPLIWCQGDNSCVISRPRSDLAVLSLYVSPPIEDALKMASDVDHRWLDVFADEES